MTLDFKYQKYEEAFAESYTLVRYIRYMQLHVPFHLTLHAGP